MWVRVVVFEGEVREFEVEDGMNIGVYNHFRQGKWLAGELQPGLLEMVCIEVCVAGGVDEFSGLKVCYLCHHH